jgi:hypothetical protein
MSPETEAIIESINQTQLQLFKYYLKKAKSMSNKPTVVILQKDLPCIQAGTRFHNCKGTDKYYPWFCFVEDRLLVPTNCEYHFTWDHIKLSEWFLPEEDHEVSKAKELLKSKGYVVFSKDQESLSEKIRELYGVAGLKYTEEDMLKCFNYAMGYVMAYGIDKPERQRVSALEFFNYINSLNKK